MRTLKVILAIVMLVSLVVPLASCAAKSAGAEATENQVATIQRGNLTIDITAAGNLSLANTADLAFEVAGTVLEVKVEEGDSVKKGDVLVQLDNSEWQDQLTTLEKQVRQAERSVTSTERNVDAKKASVTTKQRAVLQAENNLKNAEITLGKARDTYEWPELEVAQNNVIDARAYLQYTIDHLADASAETTAVWEAAMANAGSQLATAESTLNAMLTGADPEEIKMKETDVEIAQGNLQDAQDAVKNAERDVTDAEIALADAKDDLAQAQKDLAEAQKTSLEIIAPFDGFVAVVSVLGGDEVQKGTVAVQVAETGKFEADILVSEMDITQVKVGSDAAVKVNALNNLSLPAKVTHISPTATVQQNVVNYMIKVEVQPLSGLPQSFQSGATQGTPRFQRQSGASGQQSTGTPPSADQSLVPASLPNIELREGLSVNVSIPVAERMDVLLVPNRAISREGGQDYVQVKKADGTTEKRLVKTGISDWQNTEVLEGLSEGESVLVPKATTTTSTTSQQSRSGGFMMPLGPPPGGR